MIGSLITSLRMLRLWWIWLTQPCGDFALDDELYEQSTRDLKAHIAWGKRIDEQRSARHPSPRDCPIQDCKTCEPDPLLTVTSLDPVLVGRQTVEGDAILDVAAWLAASGFDDMAAGKLQRYAAWLLKARAAYEKGQVTA